MLEFSDAPYRFFPPEPSSLAMTLVSGLNRCAILPGPNHSVRSIKVEGEMDLVREMHRSGKRLLFVANHPSHSDPQLMVEVQRRLGISSAFMAAYDVFLRGKKRAKCMQRLGCFSIDREGSDRKAMSAAIDILKQGDLALTIFPEGNVYLMNDRVTPFLDGTSFIAVKAHQALKGEGEVVIVPISFKFSQLNDVRSQVWDRLSKLADDCGYEGEELVYEDPRKAVLSVGAYMLSHFLSKKTDIKESVFDFTKSDPPEVQAQLFDLSKKLVADLESDLGIETDDDIFIVNRVRKVRSTIHQLRVSDSFVSEEDEAKQISLADRAILVFRLLAYVLPYFNENPTIDRYAETVERLCEDFYSRNFRPLGPRKAVAKIGMPISIGDVLESSDGKTRDAVPNLTLKMEKQIQRGIEEINQTLKTPGTRSLEDRL